MPAHLRARWKIHYLGANKTEAALPSSRVGKQGKAHIVELKTRFLKFVGLISTMQKVHELDVGLLKAFININMLTQ